MAGRFLLKVAGSATGASGRGRRGRAAVALLAAAAGPDRTGPDAARGGGWRGFVLAPSVRVPGAAPPPAGAGPQGLGRPRGPGHLRAQCRGLGGMLPRLLSAGPGGRQARHRRDGLSRFLGVFSPSWEPMGAPRARAGSVPGQRARVRGCLDGRRAAYFLPGPAGALPSWLIPQPPRHGHLTGASGRLAPTATCNPPERTPPPGGVIRFGTRSPGRPPPPSYCWGPGEQLIPTRLGFTAYS